MPPPPNVANSRGPCPASPTVRRVAVIARRRPVRLPAPVGVVHRGYVFTHARGPTDLGPAPPSDCRSRTCHDTGICASTSTSRWRTFFTAGSATRCRWTRPRRRLSGTASTASPARSVAGRVGSGRSSGVAPAGGRCQASEVAGVTIRCSRIRRGSRRAGADTTIRSGQDNPPASDLPPLCRLAFLHVEPDRAT